MKKYYSVTWPDGETCRTLARDVDGVKSKFNDPDKLTIGHVYVRGGGQCYFATTVKELPDNTIFYRALTALGICGREPLVKITSNTRETICIDLVTKETRKFLNNQDAAILSTEQQNEAKERYDYDI